MTATNARRALIGETLETNILRNARRHAPDPMVSTLVDDLGLAPKALAETMTLDVGRKISIAQVSHWLTGERVMPLCYREYVIEILGQTVGLAEAAIDRLRESGAVTPTDVAQYREGIERAKGVLANEQNKAKQLRLA